MEPRLKAEDDEEENAQQSERSSSHTPLNNSIFEPS